MGATLSFFKLIFSRLSPLSTVRYKIIFISSIMYCRTHLTDHFFYAWRVFLIYLFLNKIA